MKLKDASQDLLDSLIMTPKHIESPARLSVGTKISRVTINEYIGFSTKRKLNYYLCACECGCEDTLIFDESTLKNTGKPGRQQLLSCGCAAHERTLKAIAARTKNRYHSSSRIAGVYFGIRERCYSKTYKAYPNYGGRGITMCQEWHEKEHGLDNFCDWAYANGYRDDMPDVSIDRIDNDGPYSPENCRLATFIGQSGNTSQNSYYIWYNNKYNAAELSKILGCSDYSIRELINDGRTIHDVVSGEIYQRRIRQGDIGYNSIGLGLIPRPFAFIPFQFVDHTEIGERNRWRPNNLVKTTPDDYSAVCGLRTLADKYRLSERDQGRPVKPFQITNSGSDEFLLSTYICAENYNF